MLWLRETPRAAGGKRARALDPEYATDGAFWRGRRRVAAMFLRAGVSGAAACCWATVCWRQFAAGGLLLGGGSPLGGGLQPGRAQPRGTHRRWPVKTTFPVSPLSSMICWMTTRVSAAGSAFSATDHRLWPGWTVTWARPCWAARDDTGWLVACAALAMTRDSAASTSAAATATTTRPRLVSRSGGFAVSGRVAWSRAGRGRAAWSPDGWGRGAWPGAGAGGSSGAVQRTAARVRALSLPAVSLGAVSLGAVSLAAVSLGVLSCGDAAGSSGRIGRSSARMALMMTSAAQTFIRDILLIMFVRSDLHSIVRLFDRKTYYIFLSRGSDIFATRPNRCLGYGARNVSL